MKHGILRKIIMTPLGKLLPKHTPDEANARLTRLILSGKPFMAARFRGTRRRVSETYSCGR